MSKFDGPADILLVDDDNVIRTLIQRILENAGHRVVCVSDGEKALTKFEPKTYDLLITDVMMPHTGGFELLDTVKKIDPDIDVIMVTGAPSTQMALDAMHDERVADFIIKPFDHTLLRQTVSRVLNRQRMRKDNQRLNSQLNATLKQQSEQIALLQEIARIQSDISASLNETDVLQKAVSEVNDVFKCNWSAGLVLSDDNELVLEAFKSNDPTLQFEPPVNVPTHLVMLADSLAQQTKRPTIRLIELFPGDPLAAPFNVTVKTVLLIAQLDTGGKPYGALILARQIPRPFHDDHIVAVTLLVQQLNVAIMNARLHADVHNLATRDPLTGLLNRRELLRRAERALADIEAEEKFLAVLMLDIDHFKMVNDTYGHVAGDAVIKRIGEIGRQSVRQFDLVGRYGGEEFMIVLIDSPHDIAIGVAQRLWQNISRDIVAWEDQRIQVTASVGVAISTPDARLTLNRLVVAADEALYRAKQGGRNQIKLAWE